MAPGRKTTAKSTKPTEVPLTEYEKLRAENLMRNNQKLQRLGVTTLASILNHTSAKSKVDTREKSGSLYEVQEGEGSEDEEVNQCATNRRNRLKRVLAPAQQDEPTRFTRQNTRDLALTFGPELQQVETLGISTITSTPQQDQNNSSDQGALEATIDPNGKRNRSMGRELDRISRGLCTNIPIHIAEGKIRPEAPMQAAKLASEGGTILRQQMPILRHWKEYKKDKSIVTNYIGKVAAQFTMDTNNNAIKAACADLLKGGQRQMRYQLKKIFQWYTSKSSEDHIAS